MSQGVKTSFRAAFQKLSSWPLHAIVARFTDFNFSEKLLNVGNLETFCFFWLYGKDVCFSNLSYFHWHKKGIYV